VILDTDLTVIRDMGHPSISMPSHGLVGLRRIGDHFVLQSGLIGSYARSFGRVWNLKGAEIRGLNRVLVVVYLIEVGLVLVVTPWTRFWDQNYFIQSLPFLEPLLVSPTLRGGVSGFGIVTLGMAAVDIGTWLRERWHQRHDGPRHSMLTRRVDLSTQKLREEVYPPSS